MVVVTVRKGRQRVRGREWEGEGGSGCTSCLSELDGNTRHV